MGRKSQSSRRISPGRFSGSRQITAPAFRQVQPVWDREEIEMRLNASSVIII
ncbi:MAG: hypothetical protein M0Q13_13505 [Methanothrix sp.]|nr:hypothetical protein [Methanothrix sp.]